jgi:hypothetical protein
VTDRAGDAPPSDQANEPAVVEPSPPLDSRRTVLVFEAQTAVLLLGRADPDVANNRGAHGPHRNGNVPLHVIRSRSSRYFTKTGLRIGRERRAWVADKFQDGCRALDLPEQTPLLRRLGRQGPVSHEVQEPTKQVRYLACINRVALVHPSSMLQRASSRVCRRELRRGACRLEVLIVSPFVDANATCRLLGGSRSGDHGDHG